MFDIVGGANALRSSAPGTNPEVAKVVSNAANLVLDLKALSLLQNQLANVSTNAGLDSDLGLSNTGVFLGKLAGYMKDLVCSYVFTYDDELSPFSEIPAVQDHVQNFIYEKEPDKLLLDIEQNLQVPSIPGNLYYLATKNDLQTYNQDLYTAYTIQKGIYPSKADIEIITDLIPRYAMPGLYSGPNQINVQLQQRWADLLSLANDTSLQDKTDQFLLDGETIEVTREADEVIAIAGLRTASSYKAFIALRGLDKLLNQISFSDASSLVSVYQQAGASPYHVDTWLARLKLLSRGKANITSLLIDYFMGRKLSEELFNVWSWLSTVPVINVPTPSDIVLLLNTTLTLKAVRDLSVNYIAPTGSTGLYYAFLDRFGTSTSDTAELRLQAFSNTFATWKTQLSSAGGILGAEAVVLLACVTVLERIRAGALANQGDDFIASYAADGLRLAGYLSNAGYLYDAFKSLVGE